MPSLLDHLEHGDGAEPSAAPPSPDLVDRVKAEGGRRRANRHRRNGALALAGLVLVAVPTAAARSGGDGGPDPEVSVATDGGGTDPSTGIDSGDPLPIDPVTVVPPVTEATLPPAPPPDAVPTTTAAAADGPATTVATAPPASPPRAATTTTALACRNSDDPACGPFRWDPAPNPNQPLVVSFTKAPASAVSGQPVSFEVTWSDGDAPRTFDHFSIDGSVVINSCSLAQRYGPWTPPAPAPSSGVLPYTTTFPGPGTYKVIAAVGTANCASPYANDTVVEHMITVK